jgi:hypothetical protein
MVYFGFFYFFLNFCIIIMVNSCPHSLTTGLLFSYRIGARVMMFNATFNNISVISWRSVLLVEETEKTTDMSQVTDKFYHFIHLAKNRDIICTFTNMAWVRAWLCRLQKGCTRLAGASDKVYQMLANGRWFSPGTPASSTTKTVISIHVVYICYHLTMLTVTLFVFKIIVYLRNIYCCRRQIHNWHRQISKYNAVISIVMQDFYFWCLTPLSAIFQPLNAISLNQPSIVNKIFNIGKEPGWLNELGSWIT